MKYLIIGAGGTGGVVGFHMAQAEKDVTLIARDAHLESIQQKGLTLQTMWDENTKTIPVKASDMQHYKDRPDVILVCVKGYSLDGIYEFIRRIAKPQTIVIPILNIYGTGAKMQEKLPGMLVTDGCIYVSANIKEPGVILQHGKILRIFFGVRQKEECAGEIFLCVTDRSGGPLLKCHGRRFPERGESKRTVLHDDKGNRRTGDGHGISV